MSEMRWLRLVMGACALWISACGGSIADGEGAVPEMADRPSAAGTVGSDGGDRSGEVGGGTSSVGTAAPVSSCEFAGRVPRLSGPFAAPPVVWGRLAPLLGESQADPPGPLPAETTYEWARAIAELGLAKAAAAEPASSSEDTVPGVRPFLRRLLRLPVDVPLERRWNELLDSRQPVLDLLLLAPLAEPKRASIFSERAFLREHAGISGRGYVMLEVLFGAAVPPPPPGIQPLPGMPGMTRRQHLEQTVSIGACRACHQQFDPLGISLEHFGVDGEYRAFEEALPIDSSGTYQMPSGTTIQFSDSADLNEQLADNCDVMLGFADSFLRVALETAGTPVAQLGPMFDANRDRIEQAFVQGDRTYASLVRAFAQSPAVLRP